MIFISKFGLITGGEVNLIIKSFYSEKFLNLFQNGVLYFVDVKGNQVEGKTSLSISQPISHLAVSLGNAKLVVATETVITSSYMYMNYVYILCLI